MERLEKLKEFIEANKEAGIAHVNKTWDIKKFDEQDIFYMIIFCLLVPGGKATRAEKAVARLKEFNYCFSYVSDHKLMRVLKPLARFPKQKFDRVKAFKKEKTKIIAEIKEQHLKNSDMKALRELLINRIAGFGYKAASHFLRNMGVKELAIIDTHVLKYREYYMPEDMKELEPSSPKNYLLLEEYFNKWAKEEFNLKPAYVDWFLWSFEAGLGVEDMDK